MATASASLWMNLSALLSMKSINLAGADMASYGSWLASWLAVARIVTGDRSRGSSYFSIYAEDLCLLSMFSERKDGEQPHSQQNGLRAPSSIVTEIQTEKQGLNAGKFQI